MTIILACGVGLVAMWKLQPVACGNNMVLEPIADQISPQVRKEINL